MKYKTIFCFIAFFIFSDLLLTADQYGYTQNLSTQDGMVFLRQRLYDPTTGSFISKDPLGVQAGLNSYIYCASDPVNATDSQ